MAFTFNTVKRNSATLRCPRPSSGNLGQRKKLHKKNRGNPKKGITSKCKYGLRSAQREEDLNGLLQKSCSAIDKHRLARYIIVLLMPDDLINFPRVISII